VLTASRGYFRRTEKRNSVGAEGLEVAAYVPEAILNVRPLRPERGVRATPSSRTRCIDAGADASERLQFQSAS
jgi:hypothetical protein